MPRTIRLVGLTLVVMLSVVSFRAADVKGQSANPPGSKLDNYAGISSGRSTLSVAISKAGEPAGSLTIPPGRDLVVGFNKSQRHSHDPEGSRFEFHGDFAVYPEPPAYINQGRFHPDKTSFQWASEGPLVIVGQDMDLVITRVP